MSSKKGASPPPAPDTQGLITAQTAANKDAVRESAKLNAINLYGPYGQVTYDRDADGMPIAQHTNLTPTGQQVFDNTQDISQHLTELAGGRLDYIPTNAFTMGDKPYDPRNVDTSQIRNFSSNAPYDPRGYGDMNAYTDRVGDAFYAKTMAKLQPQFDQQSNKFEQMMSDRGIPITSAAYDTAHGNMMRTQNEATTNAARDATLAAGSEAQRILGMEQGLHNTAYGEDQNNVTLNNSIWGNRLQTEQNLRNQMTSEDILGRNQAFNEASAFLQGSPALSVPQAPQTPNYNINPTDVAGITNAGYQNQLAAWQGQNQVNQGFWNSVGNLAKTGAQVWMMCSREFKCDDAPPGEFLDRIRPLPIRAWKYKGQDVVHVGPYAEDWYKALGAPHEPAIYIPDAVGVLLKCVQELDAQVRYLKERLDA